MDDLRDLELLINSRYPLIAVETHEESRFEDVLGRVAARLDLALFVWTVTEGLRRTGQDNRIYQTQKPLPALDHVGSVKGDGIYLFKDLHHHLENAQILRKVRDLAPALSTSRRALVISGAAISLPTEIEALAAFFELDLPGEEELGRLAREVVSDLSREHHVRVDLSPAEFHAPIRALKGMTATEAERALTRAVLHDLALTGQDVGHIVTIKKERLEKDGIVEFATPDEGMNAVGGLANLKDWLRKRQGALSPEAEKFGLPPPKGVLLLGVQGCGKSLAARAVAREWNLPLLRLEPGRLYDKYVGESEKTLERALAAAERMAPCVLMVDEIEKGFATMGGSDSDAGLSRRIFGRLLGWLQERKAAVFVVATCNQIKQLPPELMRKGRFDEIFFIDLPGGPERREIFSLHLAKRDRNPSGFDLDALGAASGGFSGAEIEQAIVSALYTAFSRGSELTTELILDELRSTRPLSVTRAEEVTAIREWARERAVMAGAADGAGSP